MTEKDDINEMKSHRNRMIGLLCDRTHNGHKKMLIRIEKELGDIDDWLERHDNKCFIEYQNHFQERLNKVLYFIYK